MDLSLITIPESKNVDIFISVLLAILSGLLLRISLQLIGQKWIRTFHHTLSYVLLPVITLVITKVISGNIALSLGMIGALSIVRFRNPVKNPFELVMFFALITLGISMAINWKWGILLTSVIVSIIFLSKLIEIISQSFGYDIYSLSFEEGVALNLIEVQSLREIEFLAKNKKLLQTSFHNESEKKYYYRLGSKEKQDIIELKSKLEENKDVINIDVRLS
tara:strand:- start:97 stop:756 length:660 start_codon:yes stop_codon:yes gene_type:complete